MIDRRARVGRERDVHRAARFSSGADPEPGFPVGAEAGVFVTDGLLGRVFHDEIDAERHQRIGVERATPAIVRNGKSDVIEHDDYSRTQSGARLSRKAARPR